jgi:hypothetical protein
VSDLTLLGIIGSCVSVILITHMWVFRKGQMYWKLFWTVLLLARYEIKDLKPKPEDEIEIEIGREK